MNQKDYEQVAATLMHEAARIETSKRPGYTLGNEDVLRNFKQAAERAGVTAEQAWCVLICKHFDAIVSIMTRPDLPVSEAPLGRFADAINYLRLGYALLQERTQTGHEPAHAGPKGTDEIKPGVYRSTRSTSVFAPESRHNGETFDSKRMSAPLLTCPDCQSQGYHANSDGNPQCVRCRQGSRRSSPTPPDPRP